LAVFRPTTVIEAEQSLDQLETGDPVDLLGVENRSHVLQQNDAEIFLKLITLKGEGSVSSGGAVAE